MMYAETCHETIEVTISSAEMRGGLEIPKVLYGRRQFPIPLYEGDGRIQSILVMLQCSNDKRNRSQHEPGNFNSRHGSRAVSISLVPALIVC